VINIVEAEQRRFLSVLEIEEFALALNNAHLSVQLLVTAYNTINIFANSRITASDWPKLLPANSQNRELS
jgi:hypothetical protein